MLPNEKVWNGKLKEVYSKLLFSWLHESRWGDWSKKCSCDVTCGASHVYWTCNYGDVRFEIEYTNLMTPGKAIVYIAGQKATTLTYSPFSVIAQSIRRMISHKIRSDIKEKREKIIGSYVKAKERLNR